MEFATALESLKQNNIQRKMPTLNKNLSGNKEKKREIKFKIRKKKNQHIKSEEIPIPQPKVEQKISNETLFIEFNENGSDSEEIDFAQDGTILKKPKLTLTKPITKPDLPLQTNIFSNTEMENRFSFSPLKINVNLKNIPETLPKPIQIVPIKKEIMEENIVVKECFLCKNSFENPKGIIASSFR